MNVGSSLSFIFDCFHDTVDMLDSVVLEIWTFNVSVIDIFTSFLILGFIISVFWKGARA